MQNRESYNMLCWESWWMVRTSWVMLFNNPEISVAYKHKNIFLSHAVCMSHGLSGAPHLSLQAEVVLIIWNDMFSLVGKWKMESYRWAMKCFCPEITCHFCSCSIGWSKGRTGTCNSTLCPSVEGQECWHILCWPPEIPSPPTTWKEFEDLDKKWGCTICTEE